MRAMARVFVFSFVCFFAVHATAQAVLRVDDSANGANNGTSWTDAFTALQDALAVSGPGTEIWVAEGVYRPDLGSAHTPLDRTSAFDVPVGVSLYGGFLGFESSVAARAGSSSATTLTGDLTGNDVWGDQTTRWDNAFHVLTVVGTPGARLIDGVSIVGGNAEVSAPVAPGGGACAIVGANATFSGCIFVHNTGFRGGAFFVDASSASSFTACYFVQNSAVDDGGAVLLEPTSAPSFSACLFIENIASGGANSDGGAVFGGQATYQSSLFARNRALNGAALYLGPTSRILGCTIASNVALSMGGGIHASQPQELTNTILWDNLDTSGVTETSQLTLIGGGSPVNYCVVQGWSGALGGTGNLGADPGFVSATGADYHLTAGSPCIDAGTSAVAPIAPTDYDGEPRVLACMVDIGCDESPYFVDCDGDLAPDACEIAAAAGLDVNKNGKLDECEGLTFIAYCIAKANSIGCMPSIVAQGTPSIAGPLDDCHLLAVNVLNNKNGLMFWGSAATALPFQGGTLCVKPPIVRTSVQGSAGNPPPNDCSGSYDFHMSQAYMNASLFQVGTTIYAQYWSRDPGFSPPNNVGLTDALRVVVCP